MNKFLQVLTPQALQMLETIYRNGSFAKAARELGLVPSALTYRVRQLEDCLDVLLFDRSSRQAKVTAAGLELLHEGGRLLDDLAAMANRVKRIADGWEPQFNIAIDNLLQMDPIFDLCDKFFCYSNKQNRINKSTATTRLSFIEGRLKGTLEGLMTGKADLAIGIKKDEVVESTNFKSELLGNAILVQVVAASHQLAKYADTVADDELKKHRVIAVTDSAKVADSVTMGILEGQDVLKVSSLNDKLMAQLRGLGLGYLPYQMAKPYLDSGDLIELKRTQSRKEIPLYYAWRVAKPGQPDKVLLWWLEQLKNQITQKSLLGN